MQITLRVEIKGQNLLLQKIIVLSGLTTKQDLSSCAVYEFIHNSNSSVIEFTLFNKFHIEPIQNLNLLFNKFKYYPNTNVVLFTCEQQFSGQEQHLNEAFRNLKETNAD